jgi:hypothetical protein
MNAGSKSSNHKLLLPLAANLISLREGGAQQDHTFVLYASK